MRRLLPILASLVIAPLALYACSSSSDDGNTPPPSTNDAGNGNGKETSTPDSGTPTQDSAAGDTSTPGTPTRCSDAEFDQAAGAGGGDFTSFPGADITFPTNAAPAQYTNHCVKVKVGSDVTFSGAFSMHPLQPSGGDTPNPIPATSADPASGAITVHVTAPGTFGFECGFHPTTMYGAIRVVP